MLAAEDNVRKDWRFPWLVKHAQVADPTKLYSYYKDAYALIRPACPDCFVAISPRVWEEVHVLGAGAVRNRCIRSLCIQHTRSRDVVSFVPRARLLGIL